MSLELWTTIASVGTFVVIATTAIAAVIQLYHIRNSNQIALLNELRTVTEDREFRDCLEFLRELPAKLSDKEFRALLNEDPLPLVLYPILRVGRLYETMGSYVKRGILILRRSRGDSLFENFEYLAYTSTRFMERNPSNYPKGAQRIAPPDKWAKEDGVVQ